MSLNRLLLRISAVNAIAGFYQAPWPTLAERLVFDSKVEPIENMEADTVYPLIVVYTDYDKNGISHQELPHTSRSMTVTFELLMAVRHLEDDPGAEYVLKMPSTDSELEASLDVMEAQLFEALRADNSAANCFRSLAYGVENVVSRRGATTEGGTKIAARQVTYEAKVIQEFARPILPAFATQFLLDLEESDGMESMANQVRALYTMSNNVDGLERIRETLGWTTETMNKLGYTQANAPVLGTPIVWLDQHGNAL